MPNKGSNSLQGQEQRALSPRFEEYISHLRSLQRREWWTWAVTMFVLLLLTGAVASLALPEIAAQRSRWFGSPVFQSVSGLTMLIFLLGGYLTYEKTLINRLRIDLAEGQSHSAIWRDLALVDSLTGLFNRRFAERQMKAEVARAQRKNYQLTVVLFDLNDFKNINDQCGHAAGDTALKAFADRLTSACRQGDIAARLGGDEFMLLLPECDATQVHLLLERMEAIEANIEGKKIRITYAVGWADCQRGQRPEELLDEADKALYLHKQSGKRQSHGAVPVAR
ncbi:MAG TPA: GGDEF domain-containing protein [Candidatus Acidoferrales bacterium]